MELTILQWLFQSIPESLALACLVMALSRQKIELKSVLFIALPYAVVVYLVRLLPISFGIHFIIFIVILAALLNGMLKIRFSRSLLISLVALIILAVSEIGLTTLVYTVTGITFEEASQNVFLWIVSGWSHIIFLFLLALAVNRWREKCDAKRGI